MNTSTKSQNGLWNYQFIYFLFLKILSISSITISNSILPLYIVDHYHGSSSQVGAISSLVILTALVFRPFTGYLVDRWGRKNTLMISFFLMALLHFLMLIPMRIEGLGIVRFLLGFPYSLFTTATSTVSADILPEEHRSFGFGVISIITMLSGVVLAPNLGFILLSDGNFNLIFMISGVLSLLTILIVLLMPYDDIQNRNAKFSFNSTFEQNASFIAVILGLILLGMPGLFTFGPLYSKELGIASIGLFLLFYGCGLLIAQWANKYLIDLNNPKRSGIISIGLLLVGYSVIGILNSEPGFFVGSGLVGIGYGLVFAIFAPMALRLVKPSKRGACNATIIFGQDIGSFLGLYLFSWLIQNFENYHKAYLMNGLIMFIPLGIFIFIGLPHYLRILEEKPHLNK